MCFEQKEWELLNEHILILTKRRNQLKQAVTKMIQEAFTYVDQMPDRETKLKFIETLRTVTAGKVEGFFSFFAGFIFAQKITYTAWVPASEAVHPCQIITFT